MYIYIHIHVHIHVYVYIYIYIYVYMFYDLQRNLGGQGVGLVGFEGALLYPHASAPFRIGEPQTLNPYTPSPRPLDP